MAGQEDNAIGAPDRDSASRPGLNPAALHLADAARLLAGAGGRHHLSLGDAPRRQRISRLSWEVANRAKLDDDVARGSPHAAPARLTDEEVEARRRELQSLARTSLPRRATQYLLNCWACQTFWVAIAMFALTRGIGDMAGWFFSAAGYSGAAVLLWIVHASNAPLRGGESVSTGTGCKGCGK